MTTQNKTIEFRFPDGTNEIVEIGDEHYAFIKSEAERLSLNLEETVLKILTNFLETIKD